MSEKNQEKVELGGYPQPHGYHQPGQTESYGQQSEKSPPPPYDPNAQYGQQHGQHPHGYGYPSTPQGHSQPLPQGYSQPPPQGYSQPPPQGYGQPAGYQPVPQGHGQPGYPQPQQYPSYGGHSVVVTQPVQTQMIVTTGQPRPTNWLVPAILACLCCFWPTGICAIVAACNANSAADSGDMQLAEERTRTARNLTILTVVLGAICIAVIIVLRVVVYSTARSYY